MQNVIMAVKARHKILKEVCKSTSANWSYTCVINFRQRIMHQTEQNLCDLCHSVSVFPSPSRYTPLLTNWEIDKRSRNEVHYNINLVLWCYYQKLPHLWFQVYLVKVRSVLDKILAKATYESWSLQSGVYGRGHDCRDSNC